MNDNKIIVLTHNPKGKWKGTIKKLEEDRGYKNWNKSINVSVGDIILLYISKTVEKIQYILKVTEVRDNNIDLILIKKLSKDVSNKLSFKLLKQHGLKPSTVNYILNNNKELYDYVTSIIYNKKIENYTGKGINTMNSLNQILYGPPGTGKTYNTINKALKIIFDKEDDKSKILNYEFQNYKIDDKTINDLQKILNKKDTNIKQDERKDLKTAFEYYKNQGQIEFITFHQSYGYEEFVEGIKPCNLDNCDSENSDIKYHIKDGVFKKLCDKAQTNNKKEIDLSKINFQKYLTVGQDFLTTSGSKFKITSITDTIKIRNAQGNETTISKDNILKYIKLGTFGSQDTGPNYSYQPAIAKYIYEKLNQEDINDKNYILIIDEINRGNISKIFGELITLIEESKRIGKDEEIRVKLPYSEDSFGVPKNLYIIGTMNTADRSIAPIDTALRRRFTFEEMPPKPSLLKDKLEDIDLDLEKLLTAINTRIEYLYDRDHTIGHSYFLDVDSLSKLREVFKNNIIPLLAEYFHDDWENIKLILNDKDYKGEGDEFIKIESENDSYLANLKTENHIASGKKIYKIGESWNKCLFKNIYNKDCNDTNLKTTEDTNEQPEQ